MSILHGEKYIVESFNQFREWLDVETTEILNAIPESEREAIVEAFNEHSDDHEDDPIDAVTELPTWSLEDYVYGVMTRSDLNTIIQNVLENRDRDYVHLYDDPIHTIVEIHPRQ